MIDKLPKGMEIEVEEVEVKKPVTLKDGNYVAAIYQALDLVPVEIRIRKCVVIESDNDSANVKLELEIGGEKGGEGDGD